MKKTFILALCCISLVFAACKKEKPYEKFIGSYEGSALLRGTVSFNMGSMGSFVQDIENTFPMDITLSAGNADNKLVMTYTPDDQSETYTATGTITDDQVVFDPIEVEQEIEGALISLTLDLEGTLSGNIFALSGTFNGDGNLTIADYPLPIPYSVTGTVSANLDKLVVE